MQDYAFCMKTENNQDDEGTLPWFANILNFDWASRDPHKIKSQGSVESKPIEMLVTRHISLI